MDSFLDFKSIKLPIDTLQNLVLLIKDNTEITESRFAVICSLPIDEFNSPEIQKELVQISERLRIYKQLTNFIKLQLKA